MPIKRVFDAHVLLKDRLNFYAFGLLLLQL